MNNKFSSLVTALLLLLLSSRDNGGVNAATSMSETVTCLAEAPTICAGSASFTTPSLASINGTTIYLGGYSYTYDYMNGLENYNGTFMSDLDPDVVAQAKETTLEVSVSIDDDGDCIIDVGNETCSSCSIDCGDGDDDNESIGIEFDCTNVPNGRASTTCEFLTYDEYFYPLMYTTSDDSGRSVSKEDNESTNVEGLVVGSGGC